MKPVSGKKFAKILENHGWILSRIQSSHHIYCKEGSVARISVPIHSNKPMKIGLQKHLMKIAELTEKDI
ncbi:TPA: type II toxin-antitoxin system HicA family toxin [bacterium]|nr:type II toxin-antitoxin system HicA family toxin [bacterium]